MTLIREAIENGLYDQFTFGDALKSLELVRAIGGEHLGGMYGTAGATAPDNAASAAWDSAYVRGIRQTTGVRLRQGGL